MLEQLPDDGDWVEIEGGPVLRVQKDENPMSVHVVTMDGAQMTIPVDGDEAALRVKRNEIARYINQQRLHQRKRHHP